MRKKSMLFLALIMLSLTSYVSAIKPGEALVAKDALTSNWAYNYGGNEMFLWDDGWARLPVEIEKSGYYKIIFYGQGNGGGSPQLKYIMGNQCFNIVRLSETYSLHLSTAIKFEPGTYNIYLNFLHNHCNVMVLDKFGIEEVAAPDEDPTSFAGDPLSNYTIGGRAVPTNELFNFIPRGDLETDLDLVLVTQEGFKAGTGKYQDSSEKMTGSYSGSITINEGPAKSLFMQARDWKVFRGNYWVLSGWVKKKAAGSDIHGTVAVEMYGESLDDDQFIKRKELGPIEISEDWTFVRLIVDPDDIPADSNLCRVGIGAEGSNGTVYVDGISFYPLTDLSELETQEFKLQSDLVGNSLKLAWEEQAHLLQYEIHAGDNYDFQFTDRTLIGSTTSSSWLKTYDPAELKYYKIRSFNTRFEPNVSIVANDDLCSPKAMSFNVVPRVIIADDDLEISYELNSDAYVTIQVFDTKGRVIMTIMNREFQGAEGGSQQKISWDCKDDTGKTIVNGLYFVQITLEANSKRPSVANKAFQVFNQ